MQYLNAILCALTFLLGIASAAASDARTADDLLNLIGRLEAPDGYNQYYGGIKEPPPRTLSFMTIAEVLDWQKRAARTSVSTAAGRYQIIRPTLERLVNAGVVDLNDRFSPQTQEKIARHLLKQTGYNDGDTDPGIANRIARVWAAFPIVDGLGKGSSAYEGVAGNTALITAEDYMAFLGGKITIDEIAKRSESLVRSINFIKMLDTVLEKAKETSQSIAKRLQGVGFSILWLLLSVTILFHGVRAALNAELNIFLADLIFRFILVALLSFYILYIADVLKLFEIWAERLATTLSHQDDINLGQYLYERSLIHIQLIEAAVIGGTLIEFCVGIVTALSWVIVLIAVASVIWHYASVYFSLSLSIVIIAFGALESMQQTAMNVFSLMTCSILRIAAVHIIFFIFYDIHKTTFSFSSALIGSGYILMMDVIFALFVITLPTHLAQMGRLGSAQDTR